MSKVIIIFILSLLLVFPVAIAEEQQLGCVYYFYGKDCEDCIEAGASLLALEAKYPNLKIEKFEVYRNHDNYHDFDRLQTFQSSGWDTSPLAPVKKLRPRYNPHSPCHRNNRRSPAVVPRLSLQEILIRAIK